LSEFDDTISLWQLLPAGDGRGLKLLKTIADSVLNGDAKRIPSILIVGNAARTHGRAYVRALGIEQINETHSSFLRNACDLMQFLSPHRNCAHVISHVDTLVPIAQQVICQILKSSEYHLYNYAQAGRECFFVPGPVVLTAGVSNIPSPVANVVDYVVRIEPYSHAQKILIVLQRLKYAGIGYESEDVLDSVAQNGFGNVNGLIHFLRICTAVMMSDSRNELLVTDVQKATRMNSHFFNTSDTDKK